MTCSACGTENPAGRRFCLECGSALAVACPACGGPNPPNAKFCGDCGGPLSAAAAAAAAAVAAPGSAAVVAVPSALPVAERRLVSVLFADLVGFTALSESRDAEEVRELLSRYFDTCRTLIERYGGTVEKFIGDAVMAVWGAPVAQEDDAERAVRAALDLVGAVVALGGEVGAPDLRARAGVLTGEAAVTLGATDQGMVAGDLVNTASRIQSAAQPGQVLVGEATRRASEVSVAYEDAGEHEMKGKAEPVRLWHATRVVAGVGGAQKSERLEAPFVGRERELRTVKDLLHETIDEGKAHLVSIVGIAGIGKSRLAWELNKYIDGVQQTIRWHRGRCLSYGEGVTYWALAEMVRTRAGIAEGEDSASAREKLRSSVAESLPDEEERRWVEPRLAQLLGLEEGTASDRDDLFAAWRLFYERLADVMPTIMLFEDIQWADASLLDFIEYLMEWSKGHALFVVTLARPELTDRRPTWGAGKRNFTTMFLEPLPETAMAELLSGLAPGLPVATQEAILERAEGIPLYAVETVRMLLDRGLLVEQDGAYRPAADIDTLAVPVSLQALISARLDALGTAERALVQDVSVLGKTFARDAAVGVSSLPVDAVDEVLGVLVHKEILSIQADRFSPERGQYGFLQDLVRMVAYDTLSKRDRKARHLAAANYLVAAWGNDEAEIVEVVASHYVQAYEAAPDADDAFAVKEQARNMLARAGERAASLAASEEALHYFDRAIGLADDPLVRSELAERASRMAWAAGDTAAAGGRAEVALAGFESLGLSHPAARVLGWVGFLDGQAGRVGDAIRRMEAALSVLSEDEPDEDVASLAAQTARLHWFQGNHDRAAERNELALELAEAFRLPEVLAHGLNTRALLVMARGRYEEAKVLLKKALEVSLEENVSVAANRSYSNLVSLLSHQDRHVECLELLESALAYTRRVGDRQLELTQLASTAASQVVLGRWDEAARILAEVRGSDDTTHDAAVAIELVALTPMLVHRGTLEEARDLLQLLPDGSSSEDVQVRAVYLAAEAMILRAEGRPEEALSSALGAWELRDAVGLSPDVKDGLTLAIDLCLEMGELERGESLLGEIEALPPGQLSPSLQADGARFGARLAATRGDTDRPEAGFRAAARIFREISKRFFLAVTLLEHAVWLRGLGRGDDAEPLLTEAGEIFGELGAVPWVERLAGLRGEDPAAQRASSGVGP